MARPSRLAQKLATGRRRRRWTQTELAEFLHVHLRSIAGWESGATIPRPEQLKRLAFALDLDLDDLRDLRWAAIDQRERDKRRQEREKAAVA